MQVKGSTYKTRCTAPVQTDDSCSKLFPASSTQFKKDSYIFQAGTIDNNIYVLKKGLVKLFRLSPAGRELMQWFIFPGEIFGLAEIPAPGYRTVYAQCCEDSEIKILSQKKFKQSLVNSPGLAIQVIEQLSTRLKVVGDTLLNFTSDDVKSRIIKLLLRLSMRFGVECKDGTLLNVTLTHKELADMVGTCRQTMTTILNQLKKENLIKLQDRKIVVSSLTTLEYQVTQTARITEN